MIAAEEMPVVTIPLSGGITDSLAEISGLAWYGDYLIILPQYPEIFPTDEGGSLFAISKQDLVAIIDGTATEPISPRVIPFDDSGMGNNIPKYEGFESIGISSNRVFLTIEAESDVGMIGYLVSGEIQPDLSLLQLDAEPIQEIQPQADIENYTDESVLIFDDQLITFYEANGANVNPEPVGHVFDFGLNPTGTIPIPTIEYRITDITALDMKGKFWAINYLFSGDRKKLNPAVDEVALEYGVGASHLASKHVERLVEFHYTDTGIVFADSPPILLQLLDNGEARNWEGIVRLDERGFLLMTDKYPGTILGFVPLP